MLKNQHNGQGYRMEVNIQGIHFRKEWEAFTPLKEAKVNQEGRIKRTSPYSSPKEMTLMYVTMSPQWQPKATAGSY